MLLAVLAVINVIALIMYGVDKGRAEKGLWRIPEKELLLIAAIGGGVGAFVGMKLFHHKTLKPRFKYGVPFFMLVQIGLLIYLKKNIL
jgi:uncharacterized membrane protein YsdA (DUF1294 family)